MILIDDLIIFLAGQLADIEAGWSVGTFAAIAEFTRGAAIALRLDSYAHVYPSHPLRDQLGRTRPFRCVCHVAFQGLYGDRDLVAFKRRIVEAVTAANRSRSPPQTSALRAPPCASPFASCRR
jgi:hypothetical protein